MGKGGSYFDKSILLVLQKVGLFLPLILAVYGYFVLIGVLSGSEAFNLAIFVADVFALLLLSTYQYFFLPKSLTDMGLRLVLYHIITLLYVIFISGPSTPLLSSWAILIIVSHIYFGTLGSILSTVGMLTAVFLSWLLFATSLTDIASYTIAMITAIVIAAVAIAINQRKEEEAVALERSHKKEVLQRDRLLTLVNNLTDAILGVDEYGKVQFYNAALLNIIDSNSLPTGQSVEQLLQLYDPEEKLTSLTTILQGLTHVKVLDDYRLKIGDEFIRLELTYVPIRGGSSTIDNQNFMLILRDVTKEKSLEEERDEFISVVSHELRTPIAIAEGAIDNANLIFKNDTHHPELVEESIATAHEQIIFLAKMTNDLSTLSRAERGIADAPEDIDLTDLGNNLHKEYQPEATKKGLKFNLSLVGKLGSVSASRLYLHELLQNFITNSIKYTKKGHVELKIERKKDRVYFSVTDTGIGISYSDQKKIFHKFYRSEDYRTRETSGTGLGLYVSKKLSKKLDTEIDVKSRLNHGSTFSFSLPATHLAANTGHLDSAPAPDGPST